MAHCYHNIRYGPSRHCPYTGHPIYHKPGVHCNDCKYKKLGEKDLDEMIKPLHEALEKRRKNERSGKNL